MRVLALLPLAAAAPLCHERFRGLERCLGHDYERLATCQETYAALRLCLEQDWKHLDEAKAYAKPAGAFNRLKPCRHGLMLYNPMDWYIGRSLEVYGEWAEKKLQLWRHFLQQGFQAIEVGAHVGCLTLGLAKLVNHLVAIEPFYASFATLAANVGLNSLQNVELHRAVVASKVGKMLMDRKNLAFQQHDFFNYGSMEFHDLGVQSLDAQRPAAHWDEYAVMKLDHLALTQLDFIKIDAEAMEVEVLKGAAMLLRKFKPLLFVEYRRPKEASALLPFLRKLMYECVLVRLPIFNEANWRGHKEDIFGQALVSFSLLCRSRHRDFPAIAQLFSTSVATEVEGLRTTPTDVFQVLSASKGASKGGKGRKKAPATASVESMSLEELLDVVEQEDMQQAQSVEAMTLEELLDTPKPPEEEVPKELTLDEL